MSPKHRKALFTAARIVASLGLLGWAIHSVDPARLWEKVRDLSLLTFAVAVVLYCLAQAMSSLRWQWAARSVGLQPSYGLCLRLYFVGMFYNLFLPTGVGGDMIKAAKMGRALQAYGRTGMSIFIERFSGLVALGVLGLFGFLLTERTLLSWRWGLLLAAVVTSTFVAVGFTRLLLALSRRYEALARLRGALEALDAARRGLAMVFLFGFLVQALGIVVVVMLARDLGIDASVAYLAAIWAIISFIIMLPISINGFGPREYYFTFFLPWVGVDNSTAITLSFAIVAVQTASSLIGLIPIMKGTRVTKEELRRARAEAAA